MSMILCDNCGDLVDSDAFPDGFVIEPDKYICESCINKIIAQMENELLQDESEEPTK